MANHLCLVEIEGVKQIAIIILLILIWIKVHFIILYKNKNAVHHLWDRNLETKVKAHFKKIM